MRAIFVAILLLFGGWRAQAETMHGYNENTHKAGQYQLDQFEKNFQTLASYVEFNNYNVWVPAAAFQDEAGTLTTMSMRGPAPVRVLPNGRTSDLRFAFRKPPQWANGNITFRVWYTGVGSAGTFVSLSPYISAEQEGGTLTGVTPYLVSFLADAPATSGEIMIYRGFLSGGSGGVAPVTQAEVFVHVGFRRAGTNPSDDYNEDMQLLGVEVYYIEGLGGDTNIEIAPDYRNVAVP